MGTDAGASASAPSSHFGLDATEVILPKIVVKSPPKNFGPPSSFLAWRTVRADGSASSRASEPCSEGNGLGIGAGGEDGSQPPSANLAGDQSWHRVDG